MTRVEEIMTRNVMSVGPEVDVEDAAWGLTVRGISGAPVRDGMGHVLGVVSKSDLVDPARNKAGVGHAKVEDVMTPAIFAVRATDSVEEAARRMVDTGAHRLIVVDAAGHLAGIVTTMDVLRAMLARASAT